MGSRKWAFWSKITLMRAGLTRPPRAKRAYLRMLRSSLTSSAAFASGVAGASPAVGRSKASSGSPQSAAFSISPMMALAFAEKPASVHPDRRVAMLGVEALKRGQVLRVGEGSD